jgi:hypothetical protein
MKLSEIWGKVEWTYAAPPRVVAEQLESTMEIVDFVGYALVLTDSRK